MLKLNGWAIALYHLFICARGRLQLLEQDLDDHIGHFDLDKL
jgi:hypothetical protein